VFQQRDALKNPESHSQFDTTVLEISGQQRSDDSCGLDLPQDPPYDLRGNLATSKPTWGRTWKRELTLFLRVFIFVDVTLAVGRLFQRWHRVTISRRQVRLCWRCALENGTSSTLITIEHCRHAQSPDLPKNCDTGRDEFWTFAFFCPSCWVTWASRQLHLPRARASLSLNPLAALFVGHPVVVLIDLLLAAAPSGGQPPTAEHLGMVAHGLCKKCHVRCMHCSHMRTQHGRT